MYHDVGLKKQDPDLHQKFKHKYLCCDISRLGINVIHVHEASNHSFLDKWEAQIDASPIHHS